MGRHASYHWDKREQCYRTDAGGRSHYFRGVPRDDRAGIAAAFAEFLSELTAARRPSVLSAEDVCVAFTSASRGVKPRTVKTHKERLLVWLEWDSGDGEGIMAGRTAETLNARALRAPLRSWADAGWSGHYRAGICRSVKAAFTWAASEDGGKLIAENPFAGVKVPSVERAPERYTERREVAAFLRFARERANAAGGVIRRFNRLILLMVRMAAHTGARPGNCARPGGRTSTRNGGPSRYPPTATRPGGRPRRTG